MTETLDPVTIVLKYITCINAGDSKKLAHLQTEDFTFVDLNGNEYVGRNGWESYFTAYPDYRIHVDKILLSGDSVAVIGKTTGSHVEPAVEVLETVLWIAKVNNNLVSFWRIYADTDEVRKRLDSL